ncbi:type 4a pilus biogenesis protein PilO [Halomonas rhizosphaerae]|uniref:Type 4a pilus biogenesis protein PilO n=1 Tax=Halomonas rhizosphaerae TaxID=3043296 RepID=A0ABT6UW99_9GAMM|nr:type 4a pilus biogenesis protein PilO [Halomonas rhizosphaerae]MDI5890196.1 type 4a pilus biogenesis protein PilO [Halomonas rhizosphaerae]MDI5919706.1 type 4a pilus biogenesis protein PilO [Halomonas rhizosphaerae]
MNLSTEVRRLRDMDWGELDIKESGGWPFLLQLICCVLVLGLTLAGMYWYLAAPKVEELEQAQREEQRLLRDYRSKSAQAANLPALREQVEELDERLAGLVAMLPGGPEIPSLIDDISETALDNQLSIDFIRLRSPSLQEFYTERPFDIRVNGDYHRIASFIAGVADLPRIVTQHDFSLAPVDDGNRLQLSMLAKTYSYRPPQATAEEGTP